MHRVREKDKLAVATWSTRERHAVVTRVKGKYFQNVGFSHNGQCLFCEEAVFLVDRDEMMLLREEDGTEFTKAQAFDLLNDCNISMLAYQVYSVLSEQRFHVYRHGAHRTNKLAWKDLTPPSVLGQKVLPVAEAASGEETKRCKLQPQQAELEIAFDVYLPQASFSKTNLALPAFSLVIISAMDCLPSLSALKRLLAENDPVVLRLCVVGDSSLSFIEFSDFDPVSERSAPLDTPQTQEEEEDGEEDL